jgi:hypothetical protein
MGFTPVTLFFYMVTIQLVYNHPLKSLFNNYRNIFIILTKNRITKKIAFTKIGGKIFSIFPREEIGSKEKDSHRAGNEKKATGCGPAPVVSPASGPAGFVVAVCPGP